MNHLTDILTDLLAFAFALGVIIVVHEAGHLLVAKAFGVRVLTFSVGFGKQPVGLPAAARPSTALSAVPLGGYVRLGGENPEEVDRRSARVPQQAALAARSWSTWPARPMNIILAIVLFAILFMVGIEVMNLPDMPPLIGGVEAGSSAAQAGLQRGDMILDGQGGGGRQTGRTCCWR